MRTRSILALCSMALLLPAAMIWFAERPGVQQVDAVVYDRMLWLASPQPSQDLLIVAVDDRSLGELGRWPWSRAVHAQLLERLAEAAPRAVLLDLFLTEPSADPNDDARLASAMKRLPVYLPLLPAERKSVSAADDWPGFLPPLPIFLAQARGVGHSDVMLDADGVARTLYLQEGIPGRLQPYVGALLTGKSASSSTAEVPSSLAGKWINLAPLRLQPSRVNGGHRVVSFASVLNGEVGEELLRNKVVLIGTTALGLGDQILTPTSFVDGAQSGVEVHASAIDSLLNDRNIQLLGPWQLAAWIVLPLWGLLALLLRLPRHALALTMGMVATLLVASVSAMLTKALWLPPAAPVVGALVVYLLWSWNWLESQLDYLRQRVQVLDEVPARSFELLPVQDKQGDASFKHPNQALDHAIERLMRIQRLMGEALDVMPVAGFICDENGRIAFANAAADRLMREVVDISTGSEEAPLRDLVLPALVEMLAPATSVDPTGGPAQHWIDGLRHEHITRSGRVFKFKAAPFGGSNGSPRGWIVVMPELTAEREAQRQREEWRRFLSHDLRSPQVTILSLLATHAKGDDPTSLLASVEREARRTLSMAEGFMDVAEAESQNYRFESTHIASLLLDARDQVWPYAHANGVDLQSRLDPTAEEVLIPADGVLLTRAIVNLLNNAVRHSPQGSQVALCLAVDEPGGQVCIAVSDEGTGMGAEQLGALVGRGGHVPTDRADHQDDGVREPSRRMGLGMSVVRAVVQRHGGTIEGASAPGAGTVFWLRLPMRRL